MKCVLFWLHHKQDSKLDLQDTEDSKEKVFIWLLLHSDFTLLISSQVTESHFDDRDVLVRICPNPLAGQGIEENKQTNTPKTKQVRVCFYFYVTQQFLTDIPWKNILVILFFIVSMYETRLF